MKLETIYKKTKTGATQEWTIEVSDNRYRTHSGQCGGAITTNAWTVVYGKNEGKANGTTDNEKKELYGYPEIPTNVSIFAELSESINLEQLSKQISDLMVTATKKLNDVDLNKLSLDFSNTNNEVQTFLKQIAEAYAPIGPKLSDSVDDGKIAIGKITQLTESLNAILDPSSELSFGFNSTMRDISAMSKSLKSLADLLERNPQAFLRGKGETSE